MPPIASVFGINGPYVLALARALDALHALEVCVSADALRFGTVRAPEDVPFTRPEGGTLYEADALTLRMCQSANADRIVHWHTIIEHTYGQTLARALYAGLFLRVDPATYNNHMNAAMHSARGTITVEHVLETLVVVRHTLRNLAQA